MAYSKYTDTNFDKLKDKNYFAWKVEMRMFLIEKHLFDVIENEILINPDDV